MRARPDGHRHHKRLKTWTNWKLHGVAMKYLLNYLAEMRMRKWFTKSIKP